MNLPKLHYTGRVPIINGCPASKITERDWVRAVEEQARILRPFEVTRPTGRPKAGWLDDFVATGRNVRLCSDCNRIYSGFNVRSNYIHVGQGTGSCTACDARFTFVNLWQKENNK